MPGQQTGRVGRTTDRLARKAKTPRGTPARREPPKSGGQQKSTRRQRAVGTRERSVQMELTLRQINFFPVTRTRRVSRSQVTSRDRMAPQRHLPTGSSGKPVGIPSE